MCGFNRSNLAVKSINMNTPPPATKSDNYNKILWGMHYEEWKRMPVQFYLKLRQSENLILVCLAKVNYSCTWAGRQ